MKSRWSAWTGVLLLVAVNGAMAADIEAAPGKGTISAALAKAKRGDTVKLAAGEYQDELKIPAGVSVVGAGLDKTKLTGTGHALVQVAGANVTITGIELRPGETLERGVNSDSAVRVERCRFVKFPHGIALMGAPLSDIIACEFKDCDIGVRAIGKASPTVWGCRFEGGRLGVLAMDGAPYIRNNLFHNLDEGMRLGSEEMPIVRNNVFWKCRAHGVLVMTAGKMAIMEPSIRNNIFAECGDAVSGPADCMSGLSHALVFRSGDPPVHIEGEGAAFDLAAKHIGSADPGLKLDDDGTLIVKNADATRGKGVRLSDQAPGEKGDIGLTEGWNMPGCRLPAGVKLPPVRFSGPIFVANGVAEEYVYLASKGCKMEKQATGTTEGRQLDILSVTCDGKKRTWKFDIDRFFGEIGIAFE